MKKRILSIVLILCMVLPYVPTTAFAAENTSTAPSLTTYATKRQLMDDTFAPKADGTANTIGKLMFGKEIDGTTPQRWYILGKDSGVSGDNTVIFATDRMAKEQVFEDDISADKKFNSSFGVYKSNPSEVFPNHYGASDLRAVLKNMAADTYYFSKAEQDLMNATTVTTYDAKNKVNYTTTDKLYAVSSDPDSLTEQIKVGSNDDKILLRKDYWPDYQIFWFRSPCKGTNIWAYIAEPEYIVAQAQVISECDVRPVANLNLSSVLFASGAKAASSVAATTEELLKGRAMTLRLDGSSKNIGTVAYSAASGYIEATKGSTTGDVALVVQGNDGTKNWYYSKRIKKTETVTVSDIQSARGSSANIDLSACKIWLETTDANGMIYAVNAVQGVATEEEILSAVNNGSGRIALINDITFTNTIDMTDKVIILDLNGHVLKGNNFNGFIRLYVESPPLGMTMLNLIDSNPTATHTDTTLPLGGVLACHIKMGGEQVSKYQTVLYANGGSVTESVSFNTSSDLISHSYTDTATTNFMASVGGYNGKITGGIYYWQVDENRIDRNAASTVTFNDGTDRYALEVVFTGKKASTPIEPVKDGYVFLGWYNGDTKYDFTQTVTKDITLTAKWISEEVSTENGLKEAVALGSSFVRLTDDIKLSGKLDLSDKKLTIDLNGRVLTGDINLADSSAAPSSILTLTDSNPTAAHTDSTLPLGGVLKGNITLTRGSYGTASHLYANGGTVTGMVSMPSHVGGIFCTSDTPTVFKGYVGNYGEIHGGIYYGGINESCIKEKTVTFMDGDSRYALQVVEEGSKAVVPIEPQKDGYVFQKWFNGEWAYKFDEAVTKNITLTASWIRCQAGTEGRIRDLLFYIGLDSVKLQADIELTKPLDLSKRNITIDLNGFVLSGADILINTGDGEASLTLIDKNPTATHTDSTLPLGGVVTSKISMKQSGGSYNDCVLYGNGGTVTSEFNTNTNAVAVKCTSDTPTSFTGKISGYAHLYDGIYYGTVASSVKIHGNKATFKNGDKNYAYEILSSGNTMVAPIPPRSEDEKQTFDGWYIGDTKYTFGSPLSGNITLTAVFSDPIPNGLKYTINGNEVTVTGYTGSASTIVIPKIIKNKPVTIIGDNAFKGCTSLTSVTIPNSVKTIGNSAFIGCSNLKSIEIPYSVSTIGSSAFDGCTSLEGIYLPDNGLSVGNNAIPDESSQVKYSLDTDKNEVTITELNLGKYMTSLDINETICGYTIAAVAKDSQENVGLHTCKGGTATCTAKAICSICGEEYDDLDPDNHIGETVWTKTETQHEQKWDCCGATVVSLENHEWENGVCKKCEYIRLHTVNFDSNGGSSVDSKTDVKWADKVLDGITAPTKDGWEFIDWKYEDTSVTAETAYGELAASDEVMSIELKAQWKDITAPVISGVENGKTYCSAQTVSVSDNDVIASVTVNDNEVTLDENNQFALSPAEGEQKIVVTDKTGNVSAEMIVTVNDGHTDENKDHKCDICGENVGVHEDSDKDHACDYGCAEVIGVHEDNNKDHACDYGCSEVIGVHEDNDKDHACDYGCAEAIGEHKDEDNDHKCDYGCSVPIGEDEPTPGEVLVGDVNGDGKVNIKDVTEIQKAVALIAALDDAQKKSADVNGDGKINISDATTIQMYLAGIETGYKIGEYI